MKETNLKVFALDDKVAVLVPLHHWLWTSIDIALKEDIVLLIRDVAGRRLCKSWGDQNGQFEPSVEAVLAVLRPALVSSLVL